MFWGLQALNPQLGGRIDFKNQSPHDVFYSTEELSGSFTYFNLFDGIIFD